MNNRFLMIVVFSAVAALVIWQYWLPVFSAVSQLRQDAAEWNGKMAKTQDLSNKLITLQKKYADMAKQKIALDRMVPQGEDIPGLLVQFEDLSSRNGLILNNIDFSAPAAKEKKAPRAAAAETIDASEITDKAASQPAAGIAILAVKLNLTGSYESLKLFLQALEENLRLMDINAIDFSGQDNSQEGAADSQKFGLSLDVYYR